MSGVDLDRAGSDALARAVDFLRSRDDYLVTTHANPDGDAIGSILAIGALLKSLGKKFELLVDGAIAKNFAFLEGIEQIIDISSDRGAQLAGRASFETTLVTDAPEIERAGAVARLIDPDRPMLFIDHHPPTSHLVGALYLADEKASSTVELIYRLIRRFDEFKLDRSVAEQIHTGLIIDTGSFLFPNTTAAAHLAAARLIEVGSRPERIATELFYQNSFETLRALAKMIESIEFHFNGRFAWAQFAADYVARAEWKSVNLEGMVNYPLHIEGVEIAALARVGTDGRSKISLRARKNRDVGAIARALGGGGHRLAAGVAIAVDLSEAKRRTLDAVEKNIMTAPR